MNITNKIRKLRFDVSLSQQEFAERIGVSRPSLSNYEKGTRMPPISVAKRICKEFNVQLNEIIDQDYMITSSDADILKRTNLYDYEVKTKKSSEHISYYAFKEFLITLGYPVKVLDESTILDLYEKSKELYKFEMFKLGYLQVIKD